MRFTSVIFLLTLLVSCTNDSDITVLKDNEEFMSELFDIIEENSVMTDSTTLEDVRSWAFNKIKSVKTRTECYFIAKQVFLKIGDNHSMILSPYEVIEYTSKSVQEEVNNYITFEGKLLPDNFAYINIRGVIALDENSALNYADSLQNLIKYLDEETCEGWILDLRENDGGSFSSMLVGLGPLLGEGICGYYQDRHGTKEPWIYENGHIGSDTTDRLVLDSPYRVSKERPIALLIGSNTASAGEGVLVAFRGKENCRSFGMETYGISTANQMFQLSNGSVLNLSTALFVDRNGDVYGNKIQPDERVEFSYDNIGSENDSVIISAKLWIKDQITSN